jgi:hypothetical protein
VLPGIGWAAARPLDSGSRAPGLGSGALAVARTIGVIEAPSGAGVTAARQTPEASITPIA